MRLLSRAPVQKRPLLHVPRYDRDFATWLGTLLYCRCTVLSFSLRKIDGYSNDAPRQISEEAVWAAIRPFAAQPSLILLHPDYSLF